MSGLVREAARLHIRSLVVARTISVAFAGQETSMRLLTSIYSEPAPTSSQSLWICACSAKNADLATPTAAKWWVARIQSGQVVSAGGGGPPCETFTIARSTDDGGPRPLRSAGQPQGLPGLTQHEWAQVQIGDKLLRFLLEVLLALAAYG